MARRRSEGFEDDTEPFGGESGLGNFRGSEAPLTGGPMEDEFGLRGLMSLGAPPSGPGGNTDRGRELQPGAGVPTIPVGGGNPFGLPKGVSVNEGMFPGEYENTLDAPAQPREPSPISAGIGEGNTEPGRNLQPGSSLPTTPFGGGPQRRSPSSPAIYGERNNPSLFGAAGGLLGGGKGAVGTEEPSGALAPTEMMKRLLQMFRQG